MGFDGARIELDSPTNTYYAGQMLNGRLIFSRDKVKNFRGIYVHMRGYCKVHWTHQESVPSSSTNSGPQRDRHRTVNHDSYEEYFSHKIYLAGSSSGDHHLPPGKHDLPFSVHIPDNCPSALEGEYGHIRYELKVVVDRAFKVDQELTAPFRIISPLDLNMVPSAREPIQITMEETYCCWCVNAGSSETLVKLPSTGYCPGQVIPVEVSCINRSTDELEIKVALKKEITFTARSAPGTKHEKSKILEEKRGPVPSHVTRNWTIDLNVPEMEVYNLRNCSFIDVEYELKITVAPEGCHEDSEDSCNLIFGTIPLTGTHIVQNPQTISPAQAYPHPPAITQQPFPAPYPYPPTANPTPYPGSHVNSPYPAPPANSPYPAPNPYPTSPFPPNPYPPSPQMIALQTSPNPMAPPNQASPYPNNPYPQSPYPPGPPQGTENPPYPITPPSNPYSNTPPQTSPNPRDPFPSAQTTGLKTGTFGFVHGNDQAASIPLLPDGASIPMPKASTTPHPYAPTAPEPSTPDADKPLMPDGEMDKSQPAYNPNV